MSYDIIYDKQFVTNESKTLFKPVFLMGPSNCYDSISGSRIRSWEVFPSKYGDWLTEEQLEEFAASFDELDNGCGGCIQLPGKKWLTSKQMYNQFMNGKKYAVTPEQLSWLSLPISGKFYNDDTGYVIRQVLFNSRKGNYVVYLDSKTFGGINKNGIIDDPKNPLRFSSQRAVKVVLDFLFSTFHEEYGEFRAERIK